ncbi:MAG: hypothetical protein BYD32DRAFT_220680 [Podila humilis]|nr:MAG: hypothetical protein BYD32DRAFT_220680 [Podila humilis]
MEVNNLGGRRKEGEDEGGGRGSLHAMRTSPSCTNSCPENGSRWLVMGELSDETLGCDERRTTSAPESCCCCCDIWPTWDPPPVVLSEDSPRCCRRNWKVMI